MASDAKVEGASERGRGWGTFLLVAFLVTMNLPQLLYKPSDFFAGFSGYLGNRWFSQIANTLELSYGCAPMPMLRDIEGFVFWYGVFVLCGAAAFVFYACAENHIRLRVSIPCAFALAALSVLPVYVDVVGSLAHPIFSCRAISSDTTQSSLAYEIVRHLCNFVGMTILAPNLIFMISLMACFAMRRRMVKRVTSE